MIPLYVRSVRGEIEETRHRVVASVIDADTREMVLGDVTLATPMRSAAKPFQALAALRGGVGDRYAVSGPELALMCASHNSEQYQVDAVAGLLERIGCGPDDLACGPHRPLIKDLGYPGTEPDRPIELAPPSPLSSNCSGKHTGMLALARTRDWAVTGYHAPDHQVQRACRRAISQYCEVPEPAVGMSGDGCGVVCWTVPLRSVAMAYRTLALDRDNSVAAVRRAMMTYPEYVAGNRRLCTAVMKAFPGQIVAKVGAGGVYGAALPERGVGIGIKVVDGNNLAAGTALLAILDQLQLLRGLAESLPAFVSPSVLNTRREVVGRFEAVGSVAWNS